MATSPDSSDSEEFVLVLEDDVKEPGVVDDDGWFLVNIDWEKVSNPATPTSSCSHDVDDQIDCLISQLFAAQEVKDEQEDEVKDDCKDMVDETNSSTDAPIDKEDSVGCPTSQLDVDSGESLEDLVQDINSVEGTIGIKDDLEDATSQLVEFSKVQDSPKEAEDYEFSNVLDSYSFCDEDFNEEMIFYQEQRIIDSLGVENIMDFYVGDGWKLHVKTDLFGNRLRKKMRWWKKTGLLSYRNIY